MSENHYLQRRTTHQDKTRNAMTISAWVKLNGDPIARGANMNIFGTGGDRFALRFENNSKIKWGDFTAGSTNKFNLVTSNVFNDLSQWYHIIGVVRTAEGSGPFKTSIYNLKN